MERKDRIDGLGALVLLSTSMLFGLNQVLVKLVNAGLQPVFQASLRSMIALVPLLIFVFVMKRRLSIKDGIFPSYEGAVRQALKVKGSGMLINSNVAPILVRAQRIGINPVAGPESPLPSQAQQETSTGDEPAADRHHAIGQAETFGTSSPTRAPPVARPPEISATIVFAD